MKIAQQGGNIDEVIVMLSGKPVNVISLACLIVEAHDACPVRNEREGSLSLSGAS